jgi:hypothetical protein
MRTTTLIILVMVTVLICHATESKVVVVGQSPTQQTGSNFLFWPFRPPPATLPTYGIPSTNSICVTVFGMEGMVNRPGRYYLPLGSVVRDAVKATEGLSGQVWWRGYSGIERQRPNGTLEVFKVFRGRKDAEEVALQSGDVIFFGHEVY